MVQPPATLTGYSFSNRLEVSKSIKGGQLGMPDGRLALRARQSRGNPVDASVSYSTAVNGVALTAQLEAGGDGPAEPDRRLGKCDVNFVYQRRIMSRADP